MGRVEEIELSGNSIWNILNIVRKEAVGL
jgi:hypothetical protein